MTEKGLIAERWTSVVAGMRNRIEWAKNRKERSVVIMCPNLPGFDNPKYENLCEKHRLPNELESTFWKKTADWIERLMPLALLAGYVGMVPLMMTITGNVPAWIPTLTLATIFVLAVSVIFLFDDNVQAKMMKPVGAAKEVWDFCKEAGLKPRMVAVHLVKRCEHGLVGHYGQGVGIQIRW